MEENVTHINSKGSLPCSWIPRSELQKQKGLYSNVCASHYVLYNSFTEAYDIHLWKQALGEQKLSVINSQIILSWTSLLLPTPPTYP